MNIIMKVKEFKPDPNQYRQNRVVFEPVDLEVEVPVPDEYWHFIENSEGVTVYLTLDGWRYVQELLDNTLEDKPANKETKDTDYNEDLDFNWNDYK